MTNGAEHAEQVDTESEHWRVRQKLEALARALIESERLKGLPHSIDEQLEGDALIAALTAAEGNYHRCLASLKLGSSDTAQWSCARAKIEFDRLSALLNSH